MRTKFQLGQIIIWKGKRGIYKGEVIGLHDDFIKVKEMSLGAYFYTYRVKFEDVIGDVSRKLG